MSQSDLATAAGVSRSSIIDFESGKREPQRNNLAAIRRAFEDAGLEFIPENGGGLGVRFKERRGKQGGAE